MKKVNFTLIEILVCLMLLSIAGSLVIYKGGKILHDRRFSISCEKLTSEILLTKSLALNYQIDIDLVLEQKKGKIYLTRKTDASYDSIKGLFHTQVVFPEVVFGKGEGEKEYHFYGNGWIEGDDKITLFMAGQQKKQYSINVKHSSRKANS